MGESDEPRRNASIDPDAALSMSRGRRNAWPGLAARAAITAAHVRIWLAVVVGAMAIGTTGYMVLDPGWQWIDALYMTVITLTTVGFREVQPLTEASRIWTMILAVTAVGEIGRG